MAEITGSTKKKVNLYAMVPVTNLSIPRIGRNLGITLTVDEIRECLRAKSRVEELIGNKIVPLGFHNFNKDNSIEEVKEEKPPVFNTVSPDGKIIPGDIDAAKAAAEKALLDEGNPTPDELDIEDKKEPVVNPNPEEVETKQDTVDDQGATTGEPEKTETTPAETDKVPAEEVPETPAEDTTVKSKKK